MTVACRGIELGVAQQHLDHPDVDLVFLCRLTVLLGMDRLEHVAHLAHLRRWYVGKHVAVEMHHPALPAGIGKIIGHTFHQTPAGIRDDQLNTAQTAIHQMAQERRPARLVFLGALANAETAAFMLVAVALGLTALCSGSVQNLSHIFSGDGSVG